jgi:uncharacterized protein Yka (UPF0111/DUF47 family)
MVRLRPGRLVGELSGRSTREVTRLLLVQIAASREGARVAHRAATAQRPSATARDMMATIEHQGDHARDELITMLGRSLVTPFDREDVFRVSRSIDDVLDNLRDFVRELDLFEAPDVLFAPVIAAVIRSLDLLHLAVEALTGEHGQIRPLSLAAKKSCNEIRRTYEQQLTELLHGDVTTGMLRRRELLRRLDVVGLRLGEATDALSDAAIKRTM